MHHIAAQLSGSEASALVQVKITRLYFMSVISRVCQTSSVPAVTNTNDLFTHIFTATLQNLMESSHRGVKTFRRTEKFQIYACGCGMFTSLTVRRRFRPLYKGNSVE